MHNSQTTISFWRPVQPLTRNARETDRTQFYAYMLLPGLSSAFHAKTLGRSRTSIATYRAEAKMAAIKTPTVLAEVTKQKSEIRPEDGLLMARMRGKSQLPYWSRLAIFDYRKRGISRRQIAELFRCSPATVANVLQGKGYGYDIMSGERRLTRAQRVPPARKNPIKTE